MKRITFLLLSVIFLFSCKKEKINTENIRLLKTTTGGPNGSKLNTNFEYDSQGRIVRITRNSDAEAAKLIATVSYSGNTVVIVDTSEYYPTSKVAKTIKFTLDAERKPLQRIKVETHHFIDAAYEQRDFINDTTYYDYNAEGLLTQTREFHADSIWFFQIAAGLNTHLDLRTVTRTFQYNNSNVVAIAGVGNRVYRQQNTSGVLNRQYNVEESVSYTYAAGYMNRTDLNNVLILAEYGGSVFFSVLNPKAVNLPDGRVFRYVEKEIATGAETIAESDVATYKVFYNSFGFLSGFTSQNTNTPDILLTYNQ